MIWYVYLAFLLLAEADLLPLYSSELCNAYTTDHKSELYSGCPNMKGFKIDIRVVHHHNSVDYDMLNGEVASNDEDDKTIMDEGKVNPRRKRGTGHVGIIRPQ